MPNTYSPFGKPVNTTLTADDLASLVGQEREGYVVEFKSRFPSNERIAKGLASLANTNGGWYIVGITTDENHVADGIPGFSREHCNDPVAKIRGVARDHISPVPVLHPQVVSYPTEANHDGMVLVVYVPPDQETPFYVRGTIYRRIHDSSEPTSESDRYAIDRLIDSGRRARARFEDFCEDEREADARTALPQGWVNLYFYPYPLGIIDRPEVCTSAGIRTLLNVQQSAVSRQGAQIRWNVFDFGHPTNQSMVLRNRLKDFDPNRGPAWMTGEFYIDGRAKMHIPLRYHRFWGSEECERTFRSRRVCEALRDVTLVQLAQHGFEVQTFDLAQLWRDTTSLIEFYISWLGEEMVWTDLWFAISIVRIWRTIGILDDDRWGTYVADYGPPILNMDTVRIPGGAAHPFVLTNTSDAPASRTACKLLGLAFGLPPEVHEPLIDEELKGLVGVDSMAPH